MLTTKTIMASSKYPNKKVSSYLNASYSVANSLPALNLQFSLKLKITAYNITNKTIQSMQL